MGYMDELLTREYFDLVYEGDRLFEEGNLVEAKNRFEQAKDLFTRVVHKEEARIDDYLSKITRSLIELNVREGDRLKSDEELEAARERYAVALSLCTDEAERDEILIKMEYQAPLQPTTTFPQNLQKLFGDLDSNSESPETLYNLAAELAIEGYPMESIRYLERVILLTPKDPNPHYLLGNALSDVKSFDRARRAFEKARECGFDIDEIEYRLGKLARRRGDHEDAVKHFEEALKANPEHLDAVKSLATLYDSDEKPNHAIDYFTKVTQLDPEDAGSFLRLGELHEVVGNMEKAYGCWKQAVAVDPEGEMASYAKERLEAIDEDS